jgi:CubicO group peptidase (beta-lactamase class C family)
MKQSDGWATASLDACGVERMRIERMTDTIRREPSWKIHAVLIERAGRLVYEEYFAGEDERWGQPIGHVVFNRETKHDLRSLTKSVVSALVGVALTSGAIDSLDTPVVDYFPEYEELQTPERRRITLRHALTMTAGLEWNEDMPYTDPRNDETVMTWSHEPLQYVLSRPIVTEPGVTWRYNGGLTQLLAAILVHATAMPLVAYADATLFRPLGMTDFEWVGDIGGLPAAASGLRLRPRDVAKFASLYLHQGRWNEQEVVPADWVEQSTRRHVAFPNQGAGGYAYHWWYGCFTAPSGEVVEAAIAVGNGGQRIFVLPGLSTAVTILAGRYNDFSSSPSEHLLREYILPAFPAAPTAGCST